MYLRGFHPMNAKQWGTSASLNVFLFIFIVLVFFFFPQSPLEFLTWIYQSGLFTPNNINWTKQNGLKLFLEPTVLVHVSNNIKYYLFIPAITRWLP